ncbi:MAG: DUF115 domain-containing protein [Brevinematales bacterium]|nr:DUF115 domain-containing protein [Brevinematales bacterium]
MMLNKLTISEKLRKILLNNGNINRIEFIKSKSGHETIKKNNVLIHSAYDPVKEAYNIIQNLSLDKSSKYLFVILGVGLGYHLEILKQEFPDSFFLPIELDDDIALTFTQKHNTFLITNHNKNDIYTFLNLIDFMDVKDVKFIKLPSVYRIYKDEYDKTGENIAKIVKAKFADLLTRVNFDKLWVKNVLFNIPNLIKWGSISYDILMSDLLDFVGKPFVVVGAGYSGLHLFKEIKKHRNKFILGTVDTALKSLLSFEIIPDIVFSLDSQHANIKDFFGVKTQNLTLFADITVSPELIRNFKGRIFFTKTSHIEYIGGLHLEISNNIVSWVEDTLGYQILGLESGGSVSTNLFHLALLLDSKPIFLIGVDLGFPYIVSHNIGSPHHEYSVLKGNIFHPSDTFFVSSALKDYIKLEGIKDEECITHKIMETYKLWFDSASDTSNFENVFNISDGLKLKGITNMSTKEGQKFFDSFFHNKQNIDTQVNNSKTSPISIKKDKLYDKLYNLLNKISNLLSNFSKQEFENITNEYSFVKNVVSKSMFPFYRGQKSYEEVEQSVIEDIKYLKNILKSLLRNFHLNT